MRVLVIGASGFIGPPLVRDLLRLRHEVAAFHRGTHLTPAGAMEILGDRNHLADSRAAIVRFAPDVVIDLILSSERQARALVGALERTKTRVVAASSIDVYRASAILHGSDSGPLQPVPLTEESDLRGHVAYPPEVLQRVQKIMEWVDEGYDKVAVEQTLRASPELRATIVRLPMIYGPADPLHRLFPLLKRMDDHRPAILLAEDFAQWRAPRAYVDNVAAAIALAATEERAAAHTYNFATMSVSEWEWTRMIAEQAGWRGEVVVMPRHQMPAHLLSPGNYAQHWTASSQRIRAELGYTEPVGVEESIRRTIEWERANPPEFDPAQFDYAAEDAALAGGAACPQRD